MTTFELVRFNLALDTAAFDAQLASEPTIRQRVLPTTASDAAARETFAQAHIYHISSTKDELPREWFATPALLEQAPRLLAVSTYGAGFDTVDVAACTKAGVCVVNQAGSNAAAVAEHTFGLMLGLAKRILECDRRLRRGDHFARTDVIGTDLAGRTLGIIGIGHVGRRVAALGRAFGMRVIATDPFVTADEIERRGAESVMLDALLAGADVVSLHCPLDDSTRGLIDARAFERMKSGALFISTARGGIHDEAALYDALVSRHLAGAGLDVWRTEPPAAGHPLLALDNVFASYHIAGVTAGSRRQMATMGASQIIGIARGERPPRLVNPEVWPAYGARYARLIGRAPA